MVSPKDNRTYNVSRSPIHHLDGSISQMIIYRDVSELKDMEQKVQQATKMEAIAILASGVAHEFNNALMGIMGNLELFKMDLPADERADKYFEAMQDSGHRMSRLTDQLLAYAQGGKYQPRDLKLDDFIVVETLPILQHDITPTVRVETHFPKDVSYIKADYTQMQMVLSAILTNSNEAIEDEGVIKISAGNENIDEDFAKQYSGLKPGPYVFLVIEDDGKGMDEETRSRIFEPFFTTKFQGRGMGMAAVYGIIKSHDGAITVESEPGKGTVIHIYLPAISAESREKEEKAVKEPKVELAMGEGTILVIEDEERQRVVACGILTKLGYLAEAVSSGEEAIKYMKENTVDLIVLDMVMPKGINGRETYQQIIKIRPGQKAVIASGYAKTKEVDIAQELGAGKYIKKPYTLEKIGVAVKKELEK